MKIWRLLKRNIHIFFGPIELVGTGSFMLKHSDLAAIYKKSKLIKRYKL